MSDSPYTPPKAPIETAQPDVKSGLGGWLILVVIGLCYSLLQQLIQLFYVFTPLFTDGTYDALTNPESEFYNAYWAPILWGEFVYNFLSIGMVFWMLYLFPGAGLQSRRGRYLRRDREPGRRV